MLFRSSLSPAHSSPQCHDLLCFPPCVLDTGNLPTNQTVPTNQGRRDTDTGGDRRAEREREIEADKNARQTSEPRGKDKTHVLPASSLPLNPSAHTHPHTHTPEHTLTLPHALLPGGQALGSDSVRPNWQESLQNKTQGARRRRQSGCPDAPSTEDERPQLQSQREGVGEARQSKPCGCLPRL